PRPPFPRPRRRRGDLGGRHRRRRGRSPGGPGSRRRRTQPRPGERLYHRRAGGLRGPAPADLQRTRPPRRVTHLPLNQPYVITYQIAKAHQPTRNTAVKTSEPRASPAPRSPVCRICRSASTASTTPSGQQAMTVTGSEATASPFHRAGSRRSGGGGLYGAARLRLPSSNRNSHPASRHTVTSPDTLISRWTSRGSSGWTVIVSMVNANTAVAALTTGPSSGCTSLTPNTQRSAYHIIESAKMITHQPRSRPTGNGMPDQRPARTDRPGRNVISSEPAVRRTDAPR